MILLFRLEGWFPRLLAYFLAYGLLAEMAMPAGNHLLAEQRPGTAAKSMTAPLTSSDHSDADSDQVANDAWKPSPAEVAKELMGKQVGTAPLNLAAAPAWLQELVQRIVRENLPEKYVHDKDWGGTDRRWDGIQFRREGLRISTHRRWKEVNDGTWQRYEIVPIDPEKNLTLRLTDLIKEPSRPLEFDATLATRLRISGRRSRWNHGVQIYSMSAEGDAAVELGIHCVVQVHWDLGKVPPDLVVLPEVTRAELKLQEFQLHRISKLDGPLVRQIGETLEDVVRKKLAEKREQLPRKINRQIERHRDRMRFSLSDLAIDTWQDVLTNSLDR